MSGSMDELTRGTRDKRGDWSAKAALEIAPLYAIPPQLPTILKWLPGYFLPWNLLFMALAALFWFWLTPEVETLKTLSPGWIAYLYARNSALVVLIYGALELRLYVRRRQGTA